MEMAAFAKAVTQRAKDVTIIANAINRANAGVRAHLPQHFYQQTFRENTVAGTCCHFDDFMGDVSAGDPATANH
jgi:hypothetical protein